MDGTTIGAVFASAVSAHGNSPFLSVPANLGAAICSRDSRFRTVRPASALVS